MVLRIRGITVGWLMVWVCMLLSGTGVAAARSMVPVGNGGGVTPARNAPSGPHRSDTRRGQQAPPLSAAITATVAASPTPVMAITAITATQTGTAVPVTPVATVLSGTTASASITSAQPSPAITSMTPAAITATAPALMTPTAMAAPPSATATATATAVSTPVPMDTATMTAAATTVTPITTVVAALNAAPAVTETGLTQGYGRLPLSFVPNQGQVDPTVQFVSRAPGLALYLTAGDATLVLVKPRPHAHGHHHPLSHGSALLATTGLSATAPISAATVRLHVVGANAAAQAIGQDQLPGIANYLVGSDPAGWHTGLPTYAQVSYQDVYPGVDLVYYGNQAQLEYDWRVAPGADPHAIAFQVQGARGLRVDGDGALVVATDVGALVQRPPTVYQQDADGTHHAVAARYTLSATGAQSATVGFDVGAYDTGKPLVIDPVLSYSTYLGGSNGDQGTAITVDRAGNAYLTGNTYSTNFPTTPGVIQPGGGNNAIVTKLNPSGTALVYSTYLGGGGDIGYGIAVDRAGDAYVAGSTASTTFPTTPGAFQRTNLGAPNLYDATFVSKLNPTGGALLYSTYLTAATGHVDGAAIAIDGAGNAYVTGTTGATDFPTTPGAFQTSLGGSGNSKAFVTKLAPAGSLSYSTYLGGGVDSALAVAVDAAGDAYVTGNTSSTAFPTTPGAYQTTNPSGGVQPVAFVSKLNPTGGALAYSTYLGGSGGDYGQGVAVDGMGNAYVTGDTASTNFPTTPGVPQTHSGGSCPGGCLDAFVIKLTATGGALAYSTYLGGNNNDVGQGVAVDRAGNAYVTGYTNSTNFPTVNPLQGTFGGDSNTGYGDAFVAKLGANRLPPTILPGGSGAVAWHPHQGGSGSIGGGVGLSVDLADGHLDVSVPGLSLPGRGPNLAFTRSWDSALAQTGSDGTGWQSSLTPRISGDLTGVVYYTDMTSATWPFTYTGSATDPGPYTSYQTTPGKPWQLAASTAGYTLTNVLTSETMTFDSQGRLLADTDAYGNQNTMTYGSNGVSSEANSGGRALSFSYTNGQLGDAMSPLWQSSGGAQGQHVHYGYNGAGQLTTSTLGAGTSDAVTTTFGYSGTQLISVTTPFTQATRTWTLSYDAQGRVSSVTSPVSGTTGQAGYTPAYTTRMTYGATSTQEVRGVGTSGALTTTYTLDALGEPITVTDGLGRSSSATYDSDHDPLNLTDANGHTLTNYYQYVGPNGSTGLVTQTVAPAIAPYVPGNTSYTPIVTTYRYDPTMHDLLETDKPEGGVILYGYDGHHSVVTTTMQTTPTMCNPGPCSVQWRGSVSMLDQYGEVTGTVDGRGIDVNSSGMATVNSALASLYTHHLSYDAQGNEVSISSPPITTTLNGMATTTPVTTTYGYDADGNQTTIFSANGNGNIITSAYDHLGRLTQAGDSAVALYTGAIVTPTHTLGYDGDGNLVREVDGTGSVTTSSYDPLGRPVGVTNPLTGTMVMTYSATEKTGEQDYQGNVATYAYDPSGRVITANAPVSGTLHYQYDAVGNTVAVTTADSASGAPIQVQTQGYDALNRVITDTVTAPRGPTLTALTAYDKDGNVAQVEQPNGDVTYNTYDAADQLTNVEIAPAPLGGPGFATHPKYEAYSYDRAGNMVQSADADNRTSRVTYDGDNRAVQTVDTSYAPTGTTTITMSVGYDPDGNALNQTTTTTDASAPGLVQTHVYTTAYNANDWPTSTSDDGLITNYGYDAAAEGRTYTIVDGVTPVTMLLDVEGRASSISESAGGVGPYATLFGYTSNSQVVTMTMPGGVQEAARYDPNGRVTAVNATGPVQSPPAATLNSAYAYGYNVFGWTTSTTTLSGTDTLAHDALGRITNESGPQVVASDGSYHWTYDNNGNIVSQIGDDGFPVTYTYNQAAAPNELQSMVMADGQPTTYYGYDARGDTTSITNTLGLTNPTRSGAITTSIADDAQGRPIAITFIDRGVPATATLTYNADGQRAGYAVTSGTRPTVSFRYQYRSGQLAQATVVSGGLTLYTDTYLYNQDGTPLEFLRATPGQGTARYWYVLDGRDSVVAVTDVTGKVVDRYAYDAWGELTSDDATNEQVPQQLRYRGYWYDEKLSWYWLNVRYYDPEIGRFLQPDPSGADGVRTYVYVGDDPVDAADPTGLSARGYTQIPAQQWIAHSVDRSKNGADPLNVVISDESNIDAPALFAKLQNTGSGGWEQVGIAGGINPFPLLFAPVSNYEANVGGFAGQNVNGLPPYPPAGTRPQAAAWRNGGWGQFNNGGNHARGWPQIEGNGKTAWFLAVSNEHPCDDPQGTFGHWHCIDTAKPGGYDQGRIDFLSNVTTHTTVSGAGYAGGPGPPLRQPTPYTSYTFTKRYDYPYHAGIGTNTTHRVAYSGTVLVLTVQAHL